MKSKVFVRSLIFLALVCAPLPLAAAPQKARVKADRTNVRLKPSFDAEVLTNLRKGEVVDVLEEVEGNGADGKPRPWSRIALPPRVTLWVYEPLLDAKSKTVRTESVHLRTGPGKNYSELGELTRGAKVTVVRSLDDWAQIEPPTGLSAFVASSLLMAADGGTNAPTTAVQIPEPTQVQLDDSATIQTAPMSPNRGRGRRSVTEPVAAKAAATVPPTTVPPASVLPMTHLSPAATVSPTPVTEIQTGVAVPPDATPVAIATLPLSTETTSSTPPSETNALTAPMTVAPGSVETIIPRQVVREGILQRAWNIQAPGYYELRSVRGEGLLNFLVSEDPQLDLKFYLGRTVNVVGTEWRDKRWKTPLIKVTTVHLAL